MNAGERDELICILSLIFFWTKEKNISGLGKITNVTTPMGPNCRKWDLENKEPNWLTGLSNGQLAQIATQHGVRKAPLRCKADIIVNETLGISLKSHRKANPAVVNHTTRYGWEQACQHMRAEIEPLDEAVERYWLLRESGMIAEDVKNKSPQSPFRDYKEYFVPAIEYFLFYGTGTGLSQVSASTVLSFSDPTSPETWSFLRPSDVVSEAWPHLIFSVRNKGMPTSFPDLRKNDLHKKYSIDKWTRLCDGEYRGALHVRSERKFC